MTVVAALRRGFDADVVALSTTWRSRPTAQWIAVRERDASARRSLCGPCGRLVASGRSSRAIAIDDGRLPAARRGRRDGSAVSVHRGRLRDVLRGRCARPAHVRPRHERRPPRSAAGSGPSWSPDGTQHRRLCCASIVVDRRRARRHGEPDDRVRRSSGRPARTQGPERPPRSARRVVWSRPTADGSSPATSHGEDLLLAPADGTGEAHRRIPAHRRDASGGEFLLRLAARLAVAGPSRRRSMRPRSTGPHRRSCGAIEPFGPRRAGGPG